MSERGGVVSYAATIYSVGISLDDSLKVEVSPRPEADRWHIWMPTSVSMFGSTAALRAIRDAIDAALSREPATSPGDAREPAGDTPPSPAGAPSPTES